MRLFAVGLLKNATFIIIIVGLCWPAAAQVDTARVCGRVADRSGHVIINARVELIDTDREVRRSTVTDSTGFYLFSDVRPGNYRMEASASGFKTLSVTGVEVVIQDNSNHNLTLAEGPPSTTVTVSGTGTPTDITGSVSTIVDPTLATQLPLNGRSFQTLFQLVPGLVITATNFANQGQFSANGQRSNSNYVLIDGVSANVAIAAGISPGQSVGGSLPAVTTFGGTNSLISTEDVQEFAVLTSSYPAEFGRMPGAQVSITSRSGTKEFHGGLFEYLRNEILDANDWFANRANLKRSPLRQSDYGGFVGGPFLRKASFFFLSYEGLPLRQPTSSESDVPSIASRNSAAPQIRPFLNAYPLPNAGDEGNGLARAIYGFSNPSDLEAGSLRIDHHFGTSTAIFARYVYSNSEQKQRGLLVNSINTVTNTRTTLSTLTIGATSFISKRFVNDIRFNWSSTSAESHDQLDSFGGATPISARDVVAEPFTEQNSLFQFVDAVNTANPKLSIGRNVINLQTQIHLVENMSYQLEHHVVRAGIDFRGLSPKLAPTSYTQIIAFLNVSSALTGTKSLAAVTSSTPVHAAFNNYSSYVEDAWRPGTRLTLSLGLRWDYNPTPHGRGQNGLSPPAIRGIDSPSALHFATPGTPLYHSPVDNFAPRIGIAFRLRGTSQTESILRAGAGVFYDLGNGPAGNAFDGSNFPFSAAKVLLGVPFPLSAGNATPPSADNQHLSNVVAFAPVVKLPQTYQWNVAVEQSLNGKATLTARYVGQTSHSLLATQQFVGGFNVPPPFTQVFFTDGSGYSNFNSFQMQFLRRSTSGPHLLASYTLSHSLDNVSSDVTLNAIPNQFLGRNANYGASDFDIRQILSVGMAYETRKFAPHHFAGALFSDWMTEMIIVTRSSPPVDVVVVQRVGLAPYVVRPDRISGIPLYIADPMVPGGRRFNRAALSVTDVVRQGTLARNVFRGFPFAEADLALGRRFHVKGQTRLQLRVEAFNVLNHPSFGPPSGQLGSFNSQGTFIPQAGFGLSQAMLSQALQSNSLASGFSPLYQIGSARSVQLAFKVEL
jgi:hypothetical protein